MSDVSSAAGAVVIVLSDLPDAAPDCTTSALFVGGLVAVSVAGSEYAANAKTKKQMNEKIVLIFLL